MLRKIRLKQGSLPLPPDYSKVPPPPPPPGQPWGRCDVTPRYKYEGARLRQLRAPAEPARGKTPSDTQLLGFRLSYWLKLVAFHPIAGIFFETDLKNFFVMRRLTYILYRTLYPIYIIQISCRLRLVLS